MTTIYNVHIYREMRLVFSGIQAVSPAEAAAIAREKPTAAADSIDDCEGDSFAALVDVQGDEEYALSRVIDFENGRLNRAAPMMAEALKAFITSDDMAEECAEWKWENLAHAFALARDAIAEATDDPDGA